MSRGMTTAADNAASAPLVRPAIFVFIDFLGGAVRLHSGEGDCSWGGNTYNGVGRLGGISNISESKTIAAHGITLRLAAPSAYVSLSLNEKYRWRPARIWLGFYDTSTGALIADPVQVFGGRISVMDIDRTNPEVTTISVDCESRFIDFSRPREILLTHEEQLREDPTDLGMEYVPALATQEVLWGAPTPTGPLQNIPDGNGTEGSDAI